MPKPPMPADVLDLLEGPNPAVITALRTDGQPVSVATWYVMDGDRIQVNMDERRKRLDYLRADPRVSVTVLDEKGWHTHVSVQGHVVEISADEGLVGIDRIASHYTGRTFGDREHARVNAFIEVDRWHAWGGRFNNE